MTEFQDLDDDQRVQIEGFRPGMYVRLEIANMPYEFVEHHEPAFPVVVGGVQSTEGNVGYVQVRAHSQHMQGAACTGSMYFPPVE